MKLKYGPYSPSRLDAGTCGFSFHKQYIEKHKRAKESSLAADRGSAVHEVFEKITSKMKENKDYVFSSQEVQSWVAEAVNRNPASYEETGVVLDMAKLYIQRPPKVLTPDAGVELRLAIKLVNGKFEECGYDDPYAFARGRADVLIISDDTTYALIYDHKTQPNIEDADTFQMGFYAWVISKIYPFLGQIQTVLHFARYGMYSDAYVWTKEDLAKIEDEIMTRISILESRTSWEATPYKNCQYCNFISECPVMKEYVEVDSNGQVVQVHPWSFKVLGDTNKAVRVAGLVNVLEEAVSTLKEELREFVKNAGPIAIPGKVFEYRAEEGINWDKVNKSLRQTVYDIFTKHGVDPKDFMSFNQTASKTVWIMENEAMIKELAAILPRKGTSKFAGYKA